MIYLIIIFFIGGICGAYATWETIRQYRKQLGIDPDPLSEGNQYFL